MIFDGKCLLPNFISLRSSFLKTLEYLSLHLVLRKMAENHVLLENSKVTKNSKGVVHLVIEDVIEVVAMYKYAIQRGLPPNSACLFSSEVTGIEIDIVLEITSEFQTTCKVKVSFEVSGKRSKICFLNMSNENLNKFEIIPPSNMIRRKEKHHLKSSVERSDLYKQIVQELKANDVVT